MMTDGLAKFVSDQEAAVRIAREVADEPTDYVKRCDAINAAISLAHATAEDTPVAELIENAQAIEKYLKGQ